MKLLIYFLSLFPVLAQLDLGDPVRLASLRKPAAPSGFTPVAGYVAFWTAEDLTGADGTVKTSWTDQSSSHFVADGTGGLLTNSLVNGHKAIYLDGSSYTGFKSAIGQVASPYTIQIVSRLSPDSIGAEKCALGSTNANVILMENLGDSSKCNVLAGSGAASTAGAANVWTNGFMVLTYVFSNTVSHGFTNGVDWNNGTAQSPGTTALDGIRIGALDASGNYYKFKGWICSVLLYGGISASDRATNDINAAVFYGLPVY